MVLSRAARWCTLAAVGVPCTAVVGVAGPRTTGALAAVAAAGAVVTGLVLVAAAGAGAAPVGRRGLPWLAWVAAVLAWELVTLRADGLPALSDLADPALEHPAVRGVAALAWLAAGGWLLARPRRTGGGTP